MGINGCKMIVLSSKARHSGHRFRLFLGGLFLMTASVITLFVSAIYNEAIATSNSELISNAVIILFITDLDEMIFDIVVTINPNWIKEEEGGDGNNEACTSEKL